MSAKKYYAYLVPGGKQGVTDSWTECERVVKGTPNARYHGFKTESQARAWLVEGAKYETKPVSAPPAGKPPAKLRPGLYFDSGTGRGKGVEISVTDEKGTDVLHETVPPYKLNLFGKHALSAGATNNYGELLAAKYALELALKKGVWHVFGDSKLVLEYWSQGLIRKEMPSATRRLAKKVTLLRQRFEAEGGEMSYISGARNPADLGFHR